MNTVHLAWRNLLRNRRRTLLTLAAICVGSVSILLFGGYVSATVVGVHTGTVRAVGHLQIMPKGYLEFGRGNPGRFSIRDYDALIAAIHADAELNALVTVATPVLQIGGVAGNFAAGVSSNFFGEGVVPADRRKMNTWDGLHSRYHTEGIALEDAQPEAGIIGQGLAQLLALCEPLQLKNCSQMPAEPVKADAEALPADVSALVDSAPAAKATANKEVAIELLAASPNGAPNVIRMKVLKAERQGNREVDNGLAVLQLSLAQRLVFGAGEKAVSAIVVQLKDSKDIDKARALLGKIIARSGQSLEIQDFHVISPSHDQIIGMFRAIFLFISVLMGVVSLFSVANAVNMAVSERTGEIGTLRALGLTRGHIRRMFVAEGTLLGLAGAAIGLVLTLLLTEGLINHAGLSWTPPGNVTPVPIIITVFGDSKLIFATVIVITFLACISAWLPARRAARLEVVEALRHA